MRGLVKLDSRGISDLLTSAGVRRATELKAQQVAARARSLEPRYPVTVTMYETDRAHAVVAIAHPAGEAVQAKRGSLTKAAGQSGLDVKGRKS